MSGPAAILREIHRLQKNASDLREQLNRLPHQLKAHKGKVARQETELHDAHEALKRSKVKMHELEVTLKSKQQQITKYEDQRNKAGSKKEYDAFQAEIGHARQDCQAIEDQILTAMVETDERSAALPQLEKALAQAKQDAERFEESAKDRQANLTEQLAAAVQNLKDVEAQIPANVRLQYERLVQARGADALSSAVNDVCRACATAITAQMHNDLLVGNFVFCKSCGRLLYLPADAD
jgi:predicted  nucleic acid-binding Zn-ribbon protein